jgi:zinc transport system substrate-binding protein
MVVMSSWRALPALVGMSGLLLAGCGGAGSDAGATAEDGDAAVQVVAAFYPLQFVAERIGGDRVEVTNLTRPGAEPHDLELDPRDAAALTDAEMVLYVAGFQAAVDDAVGLQEIDALDVAGPADLSLTAASGEGAVDPHFWLDPVRLAAVGDAVADRLAEADPEGAHAYRDGAESLREELTALDADLRAGLASCRVTDLVTAHTAFGYLADRYGFDLVGISGLSPETEPDARALAEMAELVAERGITTVYAETLVDPAVAETVAEEAGVRTAVLDPIEGLTDASAGDDYFEIMRANLDVLREGQSCS